MSQLANLTHQMYDRVYWFPPDHQSANGSLSQAGFHSALCLKTEQDATMTLFDVSEPTVISKIRLFRKVHSSVMLQTYAILVLDDNELEVFDLLTKRQVTRSRTTPQLSEICKSQVQQLELLHSDDLCVQHHSGTAALVAIALHKVLVLHVALTKRGGSGGDGLTSHAEISVTQQFEYSDRIPQPLGRMIDLVYCKCGCARLTETSPATSGDASGEETAGAKRQCCLCDVKLSGCVVLGGNVVATVVAVNSGSFSNFGQLVALGYSGGRLSALASLPISCEITQLQRLTSGIKVVREYEQAVLACRTIDDELYIVSVNAQLQLSAVCRVRLPLLPPVIHLASSFKSSTGNRKRSPSRSDSVESCPAPAVLLNQTSLVLAHRDRLYLFEMNDGPQASRYSRTNSFEDFASTSPPQSVLPLVSASERTRNVSESGIGAGPGAADPSVSRRTFRALRDRLTLLADAENGRHIKVMQYLPAAGLLATADDDGCVQLWNVALECARSANLVRRHSNDAGSILSSSSPEAGANDAGSFRGSRVGLNGDGSVAEQLPNNAESLFPASDCDVGQADSIELSTWLLHDKVKDYNDNFDMSAVLEQYDFQRLKSAAAPDSSVRLHFVKLADMRVHSAAILSLVDFDVRGFATRDEHGTVVFWKNSSHQTLEKLSALLPSRETALVAAGYNELHARTCPYKASNRPSDASRSTTISQKSS